jgi:electron transport complex protein RnfC
MLPMLQRSFFGLMKPRIEYEVLPARLPEPEKVTTSKMITLFHPKGIDQNAPALFRPGDKVKTGQKISLFADDPAYVVATVTGTIASISPFSGDFGRSYLAIRINLAENDLFDNEFEKVTQNPSLESAVNFLAFAPGSPPLNVFFNPEKEIRTIVIRGIDNDLLVGTNQYIVKFKLNDLKSGIQILKTITGIDHILLVTAGESVQGYGHLGAKVKRVETFYPSALPQLIMKNVLDRIVPAGKSCEDVGACFFSAEAVASIGTAFKSGRIPVAKTVTLIGKDGSQKLIETIIGTPIGDIFEAHGITVNEKDRVIFGGPMRGLAVYSLDHPVQPDTDAIMVLDRARAAYASDYPCINCGDCVRACPAKMQVNMLVRFLEAGHYDEAADSYDLYSCIECGLCSFVCVSRIPIFQYIKLAKYELERAKSAEAMNA